MRASRLISLQGFDARLDAEVSRAHRYGRALSVAVLALDGLEGVDLGRGRAAREALLAACGEAIAGAVRSSDVACRTGRAEFAILFAETPGEQATWATRRVVGDLARAASGLIPDGAAVAELTPNEAPEALLARARAAARGTGASGDRPVALAPREA